MLWFGLVWFEFFLFMLYRLLSDTVVVVVIRMEIALNHIFVVVVENIGRYSNGHRRGQRYQEYRQVEQH